MPFNDNALRIGSRPLSYSKLEVAKTCGFLFTKKYIERVKPVDPVSSSAGAVGTAIHSVTERCIIEFKDATEVPGPYDVRAAVDRHLAAVVVEQKIMSSEQDDIARLLTNTGILVLRLVTFIITNKCKVFIEEELAVDQFLNPMAYDDPKAFFRGKVDLIIVAPNGYVMVVDHKTNRVNEYQTPEGILFKHAEQLKAYEVLIYFGMRQKIKNLFGIEIKAIQTGLSYVVLADILKSPAPTKVEELKTAAAEWFVSWVNRLSDQAVAGKTIRGKHCEWCGYKSLCGSKRGMKKKPKAVAL